MSGTEPTGDPNYDPSNDPPGIGRRIALSVLGTVAALVLAAAWRLHAFWWQN